MSSQRLTSRARQVVVVLAVLVMAMTVLPRPAASDHGSNGQLVFFGNWSFRITVAPQGGGSESHDGDGVALYSVYWKGVKVFRTAHLLGILVTYPSGPCGPYYDELVHENMETHTHGGTSYPDFEKKALSSSVYQIQSHFHFLGYHYTQRWRFTTYGYMYADLIVHPGGCVGDKIYQPRWRLDVDVYSSSYDQLQYYWKDGNLWLTAGTERSIGSGLAGGNDNIRVKDTINGKTVYGRALVPYLYNDAEFIVLRYRWGETETSHSLSFPSKDPIEWDNNENVNSQNLVVWYRDDHYHTAGSTATLTVQFRASW